VRTQPRNVVRVIPRQAFADESAAGGFTATADEYKRVTFATRVGAVRDCRPAPKSDYIRQDFSTYVGNGDPVALDIINQP
jgi:hypothetical protein